MGGYIDRDYLITLKDISNIAARLKDPDGLKRKRQEDISQKSEAQPTPKKVEMLMLGTAQDAGIDHRN